MAEGGVSMVLDIASWILLLAGAGFSIVGGIGLVRLPDLFTRMHAAGLIDTLGAALITLGLMLQAGFNIILIKLVLIMIFILFTSPTATHALAKAALHGGVRPRVPDGGQGRNKDEAPSKT